MGNYYFIRSGKEYHRLVLEEIKYIQVEGNYATLYYKDKKFILKLSLKKIEESLPKDSFIRVHRNNIVNVNNILKIDTIASKVYLKDTTVPLGNHFKDELLNRFVLLN